MFTFVSRMRLRIEDAAFAPGARREEARAGVGTRRALTKLVREQAKQVGEIVKETVNSWLDDKAPRLAASLALYTLMSLAPLLILAVSVAGLMFGEEAARGQIAHQLAGVLGDKGALAVQAILANAKTPSSGVLGTVVGLALALFGASGVFGELQGTLNTIWDVDSRPGAASGASSTIGSSRSRSCSASRSCCWYRWW